LIFFIFSCIIINKKLEGASFYKNIFDIDSLRSFIFSAVFSSAAAFAFVYHCGTVFLYYIKRHEKNYEIQRYFRDEFLSERLYLVFMDVPDGADRCDSV